MKPGVWVGTRKGLFHIERSADGWGVGGVSFLGEPVSMVLPDRRDGKLYAALKLGHFGPKLHASSDGGQSWEERTAPAFPADLAQPAQEPEAEGKAAAKAPAVSQVWELAAGGPSEPETLWAGTMPGGLFRSKDGGRTWELVRALWDRPERKEWFGGGADEPGIHSICVDPRDARQVWVGISCGGVWRTGDGGESWEVRSKGMWAEFMPPARREDPVVQDPHRVVQCAAAPEVFWCQHHNAVFHSTDGAASWQEVTGVRPSKFGFAVAVHPKDPRTAWFVPAIKDEKRIPVDGGVVVARTRDGGGSFEVLREGLPQRHAYDLVYRHALDVDSTGETLAMGSTTGNLWISEDGGDRWSLVSSNLPPIYCVRF